ncbi:MAG: hypothetical protein NC926_02935 [Candidatus Omnitrophica bacterium]|nr:hypothetical protein [Candidatus Omnitrophota bacterium]MCM8806901.1 hypothetical protein [Candidatus Omnitrophota bacterium]
MKKIYFNFLLISLISFCECELKIIKDKFDKIFVKNDYIELEIIPQYGGVISKYEFLENPIVFPFKLIKKEFYPGSLTYEIPNFAGISDWIWPGGGNLKKEKYEYEILENSKEKVVINLKNISGIERKVNVFKNSSIVEIDVKGNFDKKSYWFHPMFCVGGEFDKDDFLIIPVAKTTERVRNITEIIDKDGIKIFHPEVGSYFYLPKQNWFCIVDRNKKLVGGIVIEKKFIDKKVIFYSWNGNLEDEREKRGITLEVIYPENENEFKIYLVSISGLNNISYLSENIALNLESKNKVKVDEKIPYYLEITSPQRIENLKINFGIGENFKGVFVDILSPEKIYKTKGEIDGLANKGNYRWYFKIMKNNKLIEDFYLLNEIEVE